VARHANRAPRAIHREYFADARRERLFLSSVVFFLTFAVVRAITYAIHAGKGPLHDVVVGGPPPSPGVGHPAGLLIVAPRMIWGLST